jgi:oligoribonuclease NrnB/cAMP/cGMP phosphodiesterase (DHH superfamily)
VQAGLSSYPFDFEVWDRLISQGDNAINALSIEGNAIERKHWQDLRQILKVTKRYINLGGYRILCANVPFTMTSDAGNEMCKEHPTLFAACYWDTPDARVYSLRSLEGGIDVSEIATLYGGGGHKHAAGFQIPAEHFDFWDEA